MVIAFPLKVGSINLGVGKRAYGNRIIHCEADGDIELNFRPATGDMIPTPLVYSMIAGEDRYSPDTEYIEVVSGSFSFGE